jgi:hypothetical protein
MFKNFIFFEVWPEVNYLRSHQIARPHVNASRIGIT